MKATNLYEILQIIDDMTETGDHYFITEEDHFALREKVKNLIYRIQDIVGVLE